MTMHRAAELAYDLATTPRNPADLMSASRAGFNQHGYPLTYASFAALTALASRIGGPIEQGTAHAVLMPWPPSDVLGLVGSGRRGEELAEAIGGLLGRLAETTVTGVATLAPGPSLQEVSASFKGNATFLCSWWTGAGLMTMAAEGTNTDEVLGEVRGMLQDLSA